MADRSLEIVSINDPAALGLDPHILSVGDRIVEVAGHKAEDQIDFHFHTSGGRSVILKVERATGAVEDVVLPAHAIDRLEIWFKAMDFRRCRCKCPFCFVDQMPPGMRETLYVKDEDFRLSFLYGNFTTMNDITDAELDKIIEQNNSPQWVSVHVVEEAMRRFIFGRPMKRDIVATLRRLAEGGITVHTQAVLVPGKNDGDYLRETIEVLASIHENVASLGVVPVGLTRHRDGLPGIRSYRDDEMGAVLDLVEPYRERFLSGARASRFVFPSDEWYVGAGREVPDEAAYEGFPQLDNGVGSIRSFLVQLEEDVADLGVPARLDDLRVVTGGLGATVFERDVFPRLRAAGAQTLPRMVRVENRFFGGGVTCSGLLVGEDIVDAVRAADEGTPPARAVLIPPNCLNHDGVTIDDMSVGDLTETLGVPVVAPDDFVAALHGEG